MSETLLRLPQPFSALHSVTPDEIDEYAHVNNAVYLTWLDRIAWAHSDRLGLSLDDCLTLRQSPRISAPRRAWAR
jgi:acyl-CoA thioester hydrolase